MAAVPITQQSVCPKDGTCLAAKACLKAGLTSYEANYDRALRGLPNDLAKLPGAEAAMTYFERRDASFRECVRQSYINQIEAFAGLDAAQSKEGLAFAGEATALFLAYSHYRSQPAGQPRYWYGQDIDEKHRQFERSTIAEVIVGQLVLAGGNRRQAARDLNCDIRGDQKNNGATAAWVRSGMRHFGRKMVLGRQLPGFAIPFQEAAGFGVAYDAILLEMLWRRLRGADAHPARVTWAMIEQAFETGWVFAQLLDWEPAELDQVKPAAELTVVHCEIELLNRHATEMALADGRRRVA